MSVAVHAAGPRPGRAGSRRIWLLATRCMTPMTSAARPSLRRSGRYLTCCPLPCRPARYTPGPPQAYGRPFRRQRKPPQGSSWPGSERCVAASRHHRGQCGKLPGGSSGITATPGPHEDHDAVPVAAFRGLCVAQTQGSPVISPRFGDPLDPARFRPPCVRNHCYAAAHGGPS